MKKRNIVYNKTSWCSEKSSKYMYEVELATKSHGGRTGVIC
jgi:hypothetical protein